MGKIHIIYLNYLSPEGTDMTVGGIQTYISNLSLLFQEMGLEVCIYQRGSIPFLKRVNEIQVYGVPTKAIRSVKIGKDLFHECEKHFNPKEDILLFGSDDYICDTGGIPFIAIQHGITWDIPVNKNRLYWMLKKFYRGCLTVNRVEKANLVVCVDSNFINWYRTIVEQPRVKLLNIPNFTEIANTNVKPNDGIIRIIFARRFYEYRGTRIFSNAIKRLVGEFENLEVTFAGEGPDENWLKEQLKDFPQINFIKYASSESLLVHENKDIAVIPTLGSEGTSLSLLEAMSAQCAVLCTNVGGMTDIVLNGYNGIMVNPDEDSIYDGLKLLIENGKLRKQISENAYMIVKDCFSNKVWRSRWKQAIINFKLTCGLNSKQP